VVVPPSPCLAYFRCSRPPHRLVLSQASAAQVSTPLYRFFLCAVLYSRISVVGSALRRIDPKNFFSHVIFSPITSRYRALARPRHLRTDEKSCRSRSLFVAFGSDFQTHQANIGNSWFLSALAPCKAFLGLVMVKASEKCIVGCDAPSFLPPSFVVFLYFF